MSRHAGGLYAQSIGDTWEQIIAMCAARAGVLAVKQYPPILFSSRSKISVLERAYPDWCIQYDGDRIAWVESKTTKNKSTLKVKRAQSHQYDRLVELMDRGAPAMYLVWWRTDDTVEAYQVDPDTHWEDFVMRRGGGIACGTIEDNIFAVLVEALRVRLRHTQGLLVRPGGSSPPDR